MTTSTPRTPHLAPPLLAVAAQLSFRPTMRDRSGAALGVFVDATGAEQYLEVTKGEADGTWTLSSARQLGATRCLVYESTANVLRGGSLDAEGRVVYQGGAYVIESVFDGKNWAAKVSGRS